MGMEVGVVCELVARGGKEGGVTRQAETRRDGKKAALLV